MTDFFVSYNSADREWAEWIGWTLEEAGYSVAIQAWDFRPGGNFVLEMQRQATGTARTIAVVSEAYLNAEFTQPEWAAAFKRDPQGRERTLIPVRVEACRPTGLLGPMIYVDLVGLGEADARAALVEGLRPRVKPARAPFPGSRQQQVPPLERPDQAGERAVPEHVPFPGAAGGPRGR